MPLGDRETLLPVLAALNSEADAVTTAASYRVLTWTRRRHTP
jgi:hypothetical protein